VNAKPQPSREYALLPAGAPLEMPVQPLGLTGSGVRDHMTAPRALVLLMATGATAAFAWVLYQVLSIVQLTALQGLFLVLCTLCFAWVALGTSSAVLGFVRALAAHGGTSPLDGAMPSAGPTALLFPVFNEDAARIAATIEAMANALCALAAAQRFHVFILSDSGSSENRARELRAVRFLQRRLGGRLPVYYRARSENVGKKAGNIADWVQRFGGAYETFVILDADSVMSGELLVHLQGAMARRPRVGLIQTVPRLVGSQTLFARLQQFAVAFYGPIIAQGFATWHQTSSNYWGHNAIVRTRAFAGAAGLPDLAGRPPLGGPVQSHDFVEAAFLRRAGWEVVLEPTLQGSYEGCPPTLIDVAVRDRRWAQGNLQHVRVVGTRGMPWVSRVHLAMGTSAYLTSLLWALSLVVGVILALQSAYTVPSYFSDTKTLFPVWPVIDSTKALYLFLFTVCVVLLPKMLAIGLTLARPPRALACSRPGHVVGGALIEMLASILIAPILMLTQSQAVIEVLLGKDSGWSTQRRDAATPELSHVLQFHAAHQVIGIALAVACALATFYVLAWMSPIFLGLVLAPLISLATSQPAPAWLARVLAVPEDIEQPAIVAAAVAQHAAWSALLAKRQLIMDAHAPATGGQISAPPTTS
jgi:membrane glycosyltransferase